ncbi:MAG: DUF4350 domain-containing protein [Novosphingobium sp.]|nr:DUF4350 domain-containing protein [Novosphingobium sp.]
MTVGTPSPANPFSPRAVLAMLIVGAIAFVLTLYFIGIDETGKDPGASSGHAAATGLDGFAGFVRLLENGGLQVNVSRNEGDLDGYGLLILSPPRNAKGDDLWQIVTRRHFLGPTIVILPKWVAAPAPVWQKDAKKGWVSLSGAQPPGWAGFADDVQVELSKVKGGWSAGALSGALPRRNRVLSGVAPSLVPLVTAQGEDGKPRILAAYRDDGGHYPMLEQMAGIAPQRADDDDNYRAPVIFVFEPDLLNNYGLSSRQNAFLARTLINAASEGENLPVTFDLTQNGLGRSMNLLTLAFTPPFLAATICLIMAAVVVGWRGFRRFGPPLSEERDLAFGKQQLVANSAGIIRRSGRLHLLGAPYAALMRQRFTQKLALQRVGDDAAMDAAIDRRLAVLAPDRPPFSVLASQLVAAHGAHDLLRAAKALKSLERMLVT